MSYYTSISMLMSVFTTLNNTVMNFRHKHKGSPNPTHRHFLNSIHPPSKINCLVYTDNIFFVCSDNTQNIRDRLTEPEMQAGKHANNVLHHSISIFCLIYVQYMDGRHSSDVIWV